MPRDDCLMPQQQQQLDALCVHDNSASTAYGKRFWRCSTCQQPFSRGQGRWVSGRTREEFGRELHELGMLASLELWPQPTATAKEVRESIMELRRILKDGNDASFHFCSRDCYWSWALI
jgi:hypothetical protein